MVGINATLDADSEFLTTVDHVSPEFSFSSASSCLTSAIYLSEEETIEDMHPCAFISKVQTHDQDNSSYKEIIRGQVEDKQLRDDAMGQELKALARLESFRIIARPRGDNILQSTWEFRRKRYPDGTLKKYKARFCVRGDQQ